MVRIKLKKEQKYYLFSGRTVKQKNTPQEDLTKAAIEILEGIKKQFHISFHFFVWSPPDIMILFSGKDCSEHFILKEIEAKYLLQEGFGLEYHFLCEPVFNKERIWEAYKEAYSLSFKAMNRLKFNSYEIILRGQRGSHLFEDHLNLITNPMSSIIRMS